MSNPGCRGKRKCGLFGEGGVEGRELGEVPGLFPTELLGLVAIEYGREVRELFSVVIFGGELARQVRRRLGTEPLCKAEAEDVERQVVDSGAISESVWWSRVRARSEFSPILVRTRTESCRAVRRELVEEGVVGPLATPAAPVARESTSKNPIRLDPTDVARD